MVKKILLSTCFSLFVFWSWSQDAVLKVMTFNIRFDNPSDGQFSWDNRKKMVFTVVQNYRPDILGMQEVLNRQILQMAAAFPGYAFTGVGREDGKEQGEYSPIFYDSTRFHRMLSSTFWLSETPGVPGSKSWNTACTRIVTWVKLQERKSGKVYFVFNTHFDHISELARVESARLIQRRIQEIAGKSEVILTGDFNSNEGGAAYKQLVAENPHYLLSDTRRLAGDAATGPPYSFVGFPFHPQDDGIIDFIFIARKSSLKVIKNEVIDYHEGDKYPSDHLPVITVFESMI
jgi:endonuclease/exonuclease/phosphatase family metal-dependent hydrolase